MDAIVIVAIRSTQQHPQNNISDMCKDFLNDNQRKRSLGGECMELESSSGGKGISFKGDDNGYQEEKE